MKTTAPTRRSFLARAALPAAPLALAAVPAANAAIIYTNPADLTTTSANDRIAFDMGSGGSTGSAMLNGSLSGADVTLGFDYDSGYTARDLNKPVAGMAGFYSYIALQSAFAAKLSYGDLISGGTGGSAELTNNPGVTGNWTNDGSQGYIGFKFNTTSSFSGPFLYGWAQISYNADKSITLYDFAYESTGATIQAGYGAVSSPVPEPVTTAAIVSLLAGSAALYRRRQQKKAAA